MPSPIPYDALKAFYDVAQEALSLAPWTAMEEDEAFAVRLAPEGETFFVCVTGSAGISRSLIFYRGAQGWDAYARLQSGELPPEEAIQVLDTMNLDFEPWGRLDPESRKRLKRLAADPGAKFHPEPVVYRPGKQPVLAGAEDLALLTALVRTALPLFRKSLEQPGWLLQGPGEGLLYHVRPGSAPDHSEGEWLPPPAPPGKETASSLPDQFALARLKGKSLRACSPWEICVRNSGAAVRDPEGAFFPLAALAVDSTTGFVAGFALAASVEMPAVLPQRIASAMETHAAKPEAFHVDREDAAAWLRPIAEPLGIPILAKDVLPQAEEAFLAMREMLSGASQKQRSKAKGKANIASGKPRTRKPSSRADASDAIGSGKGQVVYTLEVSLLDGVMSDAFIRKNPVISRTLRIGGRYTLHALHRAIFKAFGRYDEHLYEFQFGGREPMDEKARRFQPAIPDDDLMGPDDAPPEDAVLATLDSVGLRVGDRFFYWFDFGDDWMHAIEVRDIQRLPAKETKPVVLARIGASPPQYADPDEE